MLIINYTISESFQRKLMVEVGGTQKRFRTYKTSERITEKIAQMGSFDENDNLIITLDHPLDFLINSIADINRAIKIEEESKKIMEEENIKTEKINEEKEWAKTITILENPLNLSFSPTLYIKSDWEKLSKELSNGNKLSTRAYFAIIQKGYENKENLKELVEKFNTENKKIAEQTLSEEVKIRNELIEENEQTYREVTEWIQAHGSRRLKLMMDNGYALQTTYEIERGNAELPECTYNWKNEKYTYTKQADPSLKALELAEQYKQRGYQAEVANIDGNGEGIVINVPWARYSFIELL